MVGYLGEQAAGRSFKIYPIKPLFSDQESIIFRSVARVTAPILQETIKMQLTLERSDGWTRKQVYTYPSNSEQASFSSKPLSIGRYRYRATLSAGNSKPLLRKGVLYVEPSAIESVNMRADHALLRRMAQRSGGGYFHWKEHDKWLQHMETLALEPRQYEQKTQKAPIDLMWILPLLMVLLVGEWALRKEWGEI